MSDPRELPIRQMGQIQFKKLSSTKNVAKSHWLDMEPFSLLLRLQDEVVELKSAIRGHSTEEIVSECADVCNFATMIAHKVGGLNDVSPTSSSIARDAAQQLYALWPEDYYDKYRNSPTMRTYETIIQSAIDADRRERKE